MISLRRLQSEYHNPTIKIIYAGKPIDSFGVNELPFYLCRMNQEAQASEVVKKQPWKTRLKQIGWIGFFFFLIKGLIWLGLAAWFFKD